MEQIEILTEIAKDTQEGLSSNPKYLLPKYFYDDKGSQIFQDIMHMPEYYLTNCESKIFSEQKVEICRAFRGDNSSFDLIEFGSGDGLKTKILLQHLLKTKAEFNYIPIDISSHANDLLERELKDVLPDLSIFPRTGDYFEIMKEIENSGRRKVILFLGANIGNFSRSEADLFFTQLADLTTEGDRVLIGFDLKKSPAKIMKAYNDPHGNTRNFNLNHLRRLNNELGADFDLAKFEQHTEYSPVSGAVRSFLVSSQEQEVYIESIEEGFRFKKWEPIYMELSQKYDVDMIKQLAIDHGFRVEQNFTDSRNYFVDSLWIRGE